MGILSWLFPSEADRLRRARDLMARGRFDDARRGLLHCTTPEAEALYDECSAAVDAADAVAAKRQARAAGFQGWKVEVSMKDAQGRARLETLVARELQRAGVDLDDPGIDEAVVRAALSRAEQKARNKGLNSAGSVRLVPLMAGQPPRPGRPGSPRGGGGNERRG
jgi:hypothetical protein